MYNMSHNQDNIASTGQDTGMIVIEGKMEGLPTHADAALEFLETQHWDCRVEMVLDYLRPHWSRLGRRGLAVLS